MVRDSIISVIICGTPPPPPPPPPGGGGQERSSRQRLFAVLRLKSLIGFFAISLPLSPHPARCASDPPPQGEGKVPAPPASVCTQASPQAFASSRTRMM